MSEKNTQIFIAKLTNDVREKDLDYEFRKYGTIKNIQLKKGFAFIEFEDYKDAEEAVKDMDGRKLDGQRIVVQAASKQFLIFRGQKEREVR
jgi:arginine/serine-rich splicing factor 4/5/6